MGLVATNIRVGMILELDGELYKVSKMEHVTPGKGVACVQTKLKGVLNQKKNLEKRFRSNDKVNQVDLIERHCQYLYSDGTHFFFMDPDTFEQLELSQELVGEKNVFLVEETAYAILFYNENPVDLNLPQSLTFKVSFAPPEVKKATASASLRPVTLENDMVVQAPAFIKEGDTIKINTDTKEYIERVR